MRCKADVLYLKRVLPLFLLFPLMDSPLLVQPSPIEPKHLAFVTAGASSKSIVWFKMSGSIVRLSAHDEVCNG